MDDLNALRALGDEIEHQPPPSLVRQRQRLIEAANGGPRRPLRRPAGWAVIGLVMVATAALVLVPTVLLRDGDPRTPFSDSLSMGRKGPMNVLVIGSDARPGKYGTSFPPRSDTLALVHIPADRGNVEVVSLPRDLMVTSVSCMGSKGRPARMMLNAAFTLGGASCTAKVVESLASVRIDQTVTIGFEGFKRMVNALGSVPIVLPKAVNDPRSGLRMTAGRHSVKGDAALAYVRNRHGLGDGSDLDRIKRQHRFLAAMAKEARAAQTRDPVGFVKFLKETAAAVEARPGLDVGTLQALVKAIDPERVSFMTVPVRPDRVDPNRLELSRPAATKLFAQFRT